MSPDFLPPGPPGPPNTGLPLIGGWGTDLFSLLVVVIIGAVIFGMIRQWGCSETPQQETSSRKTISPATTGLPATIGPPATTTGLPRHWQIWPDDPSPDDFDQPSTIGTVKDALANLRIEFERFDVPDVVRVNEKFTLNSIIKTHFKHEKLPVVVLRSDHGVEESLQIVGVAATLAGDSFVVVSPSGPQEKVISDNELTSWTWDVTLNEPRHKVLSLTFQKLYTLDGIEYETSPGDEQSLPIDVRPINVRPEPPARDWLTNVIDSIGKILSWIGEKLSPGPHPDVTRNVPL